MLQTGFGRFVAVLKEMALALLVLAMCISGASGCASYRAMPLDPLKPGFHHSTITVNKVSASVKLLDSAECKTYFNRNLIKTGYQPVQVAVANGGDRYWALHLSQINLPGVESQAVAEECHFNTAGRAIGYGVAGLFIWPLLIPAIVDGMGSSRANGQMDRDFAAKTLKDGVIMPYGTIDGVLFVPRHQMVADILLRLHDRESGETLLFRWNDGRPVLGEIEESVAVNAPG